MISVVASDNFSVIYCMKPSSTFHSGLVWCITIGISPPIHCLTKVWFRCASVTPSSRSIPLIRRSLQLPKKLYQLWRILFQKSKNHNSECAYLYTTNPKLTCLLSPVCHPEAIKSMLSIGKRLCWKTFTKCVRLFCKNLTVGLRYSK